MFIDLSHIFNEKMTVYPDTLRPEFKVQSTVEKDGYAELKMTMVLHTGTHIDAPCHMFKNAKSIDRFPIDKFIGKAMVIPCQNIDELSLDYLQPYEEQIAQIDFLLFFTGWQYKWNTPAYFDDSPTPAIEAARWLSKFNLKGIGFDSFSIDKIISAHTVTPENLPNHHLFLEKEILLIENLTNLDKLPDNPFLFQCLPLKLENADGSPVRPIAII